jgi:hypothetical protein
MAVLLLSPVGGGAQERGSPRAAGQREPEWAINMSNIEACSCHVFCPCYFVGQPSPASAGGGHANHGGGGAAAADAYCRFNNAFKVNKGNWGGTKLDGMKFWMAGDLGGDFANGFDWAVVTFEPGTSPEKRQAVQAIVKHVFPGQWKSFTEGKDAKIEWSADKDRATATLDGGKAAEVVLKRSTGMNDEPVVIQNLKFWAATRNDGFKVMPNEVQAYRVGDKAFETKGTNGFVTTLEMKSGDVKAPASGG